VTTKLDLTPRTRLEGVTITGTALVEEGADPAAEVALLKSAAADPSVDEVAPGAWPDPTDDLDEIRELEAELLEAAGPRLAKGRSVDEVLAAIEDSDEGQRYVTLGKELADKHPKGPRGVDRLRALLKPPAAAKDPEAEPVEKAASEADVMRLYRAGLLQTEQGRKVLETVRELLTQTETEADMTARETSLGELRNAAKQEAEQVDRDELERRLLEIQKRDPQLRSEEGRSAYRALENARTRKTSARAEYADRMVDEEVRPIAALLRTDGLGEAAAIRKARALVPGLEALAVELARVVASGAGLDALEKGHAERAARCATLAAAVCDRVSKSAGQVQRTMEQALRDELAAA
jgi:hypothetical protein